MNKYTLKLVFDYSEISKKQEIWRRKQFDIFYGTGRPIYNINEATEHIRFHNNPLYIKDTNRRVNNMNK